MLQESHTTKLQGAHFKLGIVLMCLYFLGPVLGPMGLTQQVD